MSALPKILQNLSGNADSWRYAHAARLDRYEFGAPMQGGQLPARKSEAYPLVAQDGRWQDVTLPEGCALAIDGTGATLTIADYTDLECELILSLSGVPRAVATEMQLEIRLGQDASLRLLEWSESHGGGDAPALQILQATIQLADNATLQHVRLTGCDHVFTETSAKIAADAHYHYFASVKGGLQSRHALCVELQAEGAQTTLAGVYQLQENDMAEHAILIEHQAPRTESRQHFRGVVDGSARGTFQGKVHVHQIAQETDAQQLHKALLLSPRAEVNAKPELEIYADNVKCSHGNTVGALDEDALFYLRARGIGQAEAQQLLTGAFAAAVLNEAPCFRDIVMAQAGIDAVS